MIALSPSRCNHGFSEIFAEKIREEVGNHILITTLAQ